MWVCVYVSVCWEYAAVLFNFKDAGTLWCVRLHADRLSLMNNYLQQCKTNPLIMMPPLGDVSTWLTHDACFVQHSFVLLRAVFGWTIMQLFYHHSAGCSLNAYSPPTVGDLLENISARQMILQFFMATPSLDLVTGQNTESGSISLWWWLCPWLNKQHTLLLSHENLLNTRSCTVHQRQNTSKTRTTIYSIYMCVFQDQTC